MNSKIRFSSGLEIVPGFSVIRISAGTDSCHLLTDGRRILLINCIDGLRPERFSIEELPLPNEIWHTEISPGLAAEGEHFAKATVRLPAAFREVAADSDRYRASIDTVWENPEEWMESFGREAYGIAGCTVLHPPHAPLRDFSTFEPGGSICWEGLEFEIVDLGVRQFYAVGFLLKSNDRPVALFAGSLIDGNGDLCDAHRFEASYSGIPWERLSHTFRTLARKNTAWLFPSQGDPLPEPAAKLNAMADRIGSFVQPSTPAAVAPEPTQSVLPAKIGRYRDHGDGIFQITNFGNTIVLIDSEGRGLLVDPGPCDFMNPRRREEFLEDFDRLETQAGLRTIDLVLVTHFHGDHYDLWPVVKDRYPECRLAAWGPVADVIEHPEAYPYACRLPWYRVGWERCKVDLHLSRQAPTQWHGTDIHSIHLPGHCNVHAAYWLQWQGRKLLISGDSIQTSGQVDSLQFIIANHSVPGTDEGHAAAYENAAQLPIDLNLGGHSSYFKDCRKVYAASLKHIEQTSAQLLALFGDRDPEAVFLRPGFKGSANRTRALMARF